MVQGRLDNAAKLALLRSPHGNVNALLDDCADCAVDALMPQPPWDEAGYRAVLVRVRGGLTATVVAVLGQVRQIVALATEVAPRIDAAPEPARTDLRDQLAGLVYPGFVTATGWSQLPQLPRYLRAAQRRLDRLAENPARDRDQLRAISDVQRGAVVQPWPATKNLPSGASDGDCIVILGKTQ